MKKVTLTADGRLQHPDWSQPTDEKTGESVAQDVTATAEQFLFHELELAADATLRSVFLLMQASPGLRAVFKRYCADEICAEGMGDAPPAVHRGIDPKRIEALYVYRAFERDSNLKSLSGLQPCFHGLGPVLKEDVVESGHVVYAKGQREAFGFTFTSPQVLRDLPLLLDPNLPIHEESTSFEKWWERIERLQCTEFHLGEVLEAIFTELTYDAPDEAEEENTQLLTA